MQIERITSFNLRHFEAVLPSSFVIKAETSNILEEKDTVWLGGDDDLGLPVASLICQAIPDNRQNLWLHFIYVRKSHRRQGIATTMLQAVPAYFQEDPVVLRCECKMALDEEENAFTEWCRRNGFRRFLARERFFFDASRLLEKCQSNLASDFSIVPALDGTFAKQEKLQETADLLFQQFRELKYDLSPEARERQREIRNKMVLVPHEDIYRIIELSTGKEAGFFSCDIRGEYYQINGMCIHPEFRNRVFIWKMAAGHAAKQALVRKLNLSFTFLDWREKYAQGVTRFGPSFGLIHREIMYSFEIKYVGRHV